MNDPVQKVNVFHSQTACLAEPQANESAKQYGKAHSFREQFVESPNLFGGGYIYSLLAKTRRRSPRTWRLGDQSVMDRIAHDLSET